MIHHRFRRSSIVHGLIAAWLLVGMGPAVVTTTAADPVSDSESRLDAMLDASPLKDAESGIAPLNDAQVDPPLQKDTSPPKDAMWHLTHEQPPVFADAHTLIPLTRWGWSMPFEAGVELCEKWGFALELAEISNWRVLKKFDDPESDESRICALAASDPERYPLFVIAPRPLRDMEFQAEHASPDETHVRDADGKPFTAPKWKTWNPEAPDSLFEAAGEEVAKSLARIQEKAPIAIVLNGGEYAQGVLGHCQPYWSKDPRVVEAKGDLDWFTYISRQKAAKEQFITDAVRRQVPDRKLYLWYHFGFIPGKLDRRWSWDYESVQSVADMPGQSIYYRHFNSGWTGRDDLLTKFLVSVAMAEGYGDALSYNWLSAGWGGRHNKFSPRDRYMGFLKCMYTAGQVGAVAGYFDYPKDGFKAEDLGDEMPSWLWQMVDLGHAQALFSHVDEFIREGDLLPGPDKSRMAPSFPAYEFPTGDPNARVLARKLRDKPAWLITAWAADGPARDVTVTIPELGSVTVNARPAGSVYRATREDVLEHEPPAPKLEHLDPDAMHPSAGFAAAKQ